MAMRSKGRPGQSADEMTVHAPGYQRRDAEVIDYRMYELGATGLSFRGPPPADLTPGSYFACIGAAQTFGCFCEAPYPALLAARLGLPALNLGYGGAGPEFFNRQTRLHDYINNARFVIVQVMSGRSQSNPLYESGGLEYVRRRRDGARMSARQAFDELLEGPKALRNLPMAPKAGRALARAIALPSAIGVVRETQAAWVDNLNALAGVIRAPKALFWFSKRQPDYRPGWRHASTLLGEFPHLINAQMIARSRDAFDAYIECVSSRGSPQPLYKAGTTELAVVHTRNDREDLASKPWTENKYYPSPEMHEDAAEALENACRDLVSRGRA